MTEPPSLRLRLILVSALAIVVALFVSGEVLTALFAKHAERVAVQELNDELNRLTSLVAAHPSDLAITEPMGDPQFDMPYGGSYWQVRDPATGESVRSRSMWDKSFDFQEFALVPTEPTKLNVVDPQGGPALGLGRALSFQTGTGSRRTLELVVATSLADLDAAVAAYRGDVFWARLAVAIILIAAAWVQVTVGLSPLRSVRDGLAAIRTGQATELHGAFPREVLPLVSEFNHLSRAQHLAIEFARSRAADLAHGLKSALQVLSSQAHQLRLHGNADAADEVDEVIVQMTSMIDHQLALARLRQRLPHSSQSTDLRSVTDRIVRTLRKAKQGESLQWHIDIAAGTTVALDEADVFELLGALLENAAKWAVSEVRVGGVIDAGMCRLSVDDDGPGLTAAQIEQLGRRGARLDELKSGTGIGLSIVREIVAINGGDVSYARSGLGGLGVTVRIAATPPLV